MTQQKPPSPQDLAQQRMQEEALHVAKSVQVPGQTKEQTKLIAKGIEKGIAIYKQQQKAKARELDKAKKKAQKRKSLGTETQADDELQSFDDGGAQALSALRVAGGIFALVALLHGVRYGMGWPVVIGQLEIPLAWSLAGALVAAGLAIWMFRSASD